MHANALGLRKPLETTGAPATNIAIAQSTPATCAACVLFQINLDALTSAHAAQVELIRLGPWTRTSCVSFCSFSHAFFERFWGSGIRCPSWCAAFGWPPNGPDREPIRKNTGLNEARTVFGSFRAASVSLAASSKARSFLEEMPHTVTLDFAHSSLLIVIKWAGLRCPNNYSEGSR